MVYALGITGGIGSGKSAACRILRALGARVFDADAVARELMEHASSVRQKVMAAFGPEAYTPRLNRSWLAAQVFGSESAVAQLNAIVHPLVRDAFTIARSDATREQVSLLVHEAALIFESGLDAMLDSVAVVDAPLPTRIERVMRRDGTTEAAVRARIRHQLPAEVLKRRADHVLDNSGQLAMLRPQVEQLFAVVTSETPMQRKSAKIQK